MPNQPDPEIPDRSPQDGCRGVVTPQGARYYLFVNGCYDGPFALKDLSRKVLEGTVNPETLFATDPTMPLRPLRQLYDAMFPSWR